MTREKVDEWLLAMEKTSICGLGQASPIPVRNAMRWSRALRAARRRASIQRSAASVLRGGTVGRTSSSRDCPCRRSRRRERRSVVARRGSPAERGLGEPVTQHESSSSELPRPTTVAKETSLLALDVRLQHTSATWSACTCSNRVSRDDDSRRQEDLLAEGQDRSAGRPGRYHDDPGTRDAPFLLPTATRIAASLLRPWERDAAHRSAAGSRSGRLPSQAARISSHSDARICLPTPT